uniref:Choline/carnitine acyltransferase domain-containing protein n=2 Tax=Arion vulgaris TaxID=1028688 RepID=A0A0B7BDL7_9EUPU
MIRSLKKPLLRALSKMVVEGQQRIIPKGRTFSVQYSLPKLPVPALDQTLKKYLDSCRPLLTDDEYNTTLQVVNRFRLKEGPDLHKLLEERAQKEVNWLSEWWKYWAYLDARVSVLINVSPGIFLPRQNYRGLKEQLEFAAKFISGVLDYKTMLDAQTIPVDTLGGKPLCMSQHYQLLNACRIPGLKTDSHICVDPNEPSQPKHITVIYNNHLFSVNVFGDQGKPLSIAQLSSQLHNCVNLSKDAVAPVGILTTMDRTTWGQVYTDMIKDKTNKESLENIQGSIFVVCLDGPLPSQIGNPVDVAASMILHGGGSKAYSGNRWYDKTMQFIFNPDGFVGLNYEHTTAEGPAVIGLSDHVLDYTERNQDTGATTSNAKAPQLLHFNISGKTQEAIDKGSQEADVAANDVMLRGLFFKDYGKNFIKQQKLSPDAYIQMAFQLAYYRIYKEPCATYETGSLRRFQLGRTDTIRSCSIASLAFTKVMDDPSVPGAKKVDLLRQAIQSHRKYTDDTINGQGIDRHLLGLRLTALEKGKETPGIFNDPAFRKSTHYQISTSQVSFV